MMHPTVAAQPMPTSPTMAATHRWLRSFIRSCHGQSRVMTVPSCRRYSRTHCGPFGRCNRSAASRRVIALRLYTSRSQCSQWRFCASPVISCQLAGHGDAMSILFSTSSLTLLSFTVWALHLLLVVSLTNDEARGGRKPFQRFFRSRARLRPMGLIRDTSGRCGGTFASRRFN